MSSSMGLTRPRGVVGKLSSPDRRDYGGCSLHAEIWTLAFPPISQNYAKWMGHPAVEVVAIPGPQNRGPGAPTCLGKFSIPGLAPRP